MARLKKAPPRGIVKSEADFAFGHHHARYEVDAPLDRSIEHWWSVAWKLPEGRQFAATTLAHPSIHVVWEADEVRVVGVNTGRFTRVLEGHSRAFAAKFRPGAFRGLLGKSVSTLTDRIVPFSSVVGARKARAYREEMKKARDDDQRVRVATTFFGDELPPPSHDADLLAELVHAATVDRSITSVEALRERAGMHLRELQRWFRDAVGISPKWMIQRYRLHDALLELEAGNRSLAQVAASLGYSDHAHFSRDFKALVGFPPSRYASGSRR
ncbi:MAG: helix-turn-helix domain-containing protein [Archangium sp.]